ncbi:iron-sulfur cluster biosynthesis transcriptional regulator SufR [Synechococcus sp. RSCCF101]|uniref:iron-sulfur cluster biosynthesis transcriptional regulator SufR n=1 Tax=Synechococcus sp. RSCCF101 TaxID=2511069 RepID=UPI001249233B|nr:iron-sulfur cluster biosynthesis transcriptional regulator SufR [Synechococcus sp. RSCCF101]QEY32976.1 iron-sulfur cluster biosynthesis transcriptional regulator SufR [Synechococcus sp. RSCCF101]
MATTAQPATRDAVLAVLLRLGECSAADLASELGLSVQILRRHLRSLQESGLVESTPTPTGPGRPCNRWTLTRQGRSRFPDASEAFALDLLDSLVQHLPKSTLQGLLEQQLHDKALHYSRAIPSGDLESRVQQLVHLRRQEGHLSEASPEPDGPGWRISEMHCSVARIAEQHPIICDLELKLIRALFPDCRVERVHWRLQEGHSCGFRLTPSAPVAADASL